MNTVTLTADSSCYGNEKQYVARITGRDSKYTFAREFIGRKSGRITQAVIDEPGLYEITDIDKKGNKESIYRIVVAVEDGITALKAQRDNLDGGDADSIVMGLAKRLSAGESFASIVRPEKREDGSWAYRIISAAAAVRADKAASIDQAVADCWEILQAFPEPQAKKILAALRTRVSPKPVAVETTETENVAEVAEEKPALITA